MDYGIIPILIGFLSIFLVNVHQNALAQDPYGIASCKVCGLSMSSSTQLMSAKPKHMIVNGDKVTPPNKYPWMVSLVKKQDKSNLCGGAIISSSFILTAGHCFRRSSNYASQKGTMCENPDGNQVACYLSGKELVIGFLSETNERRPEAEIAEITVHPQFSFNTGLKNDIALVKLLKPLVCHSYANPICLPPVNLKTPPQTPVTVSGWGTTRPGLEKESKDLKEARIFIQSPSKCRFIDFYKEETAFCLRGGPKQSPCFGDSGGSMFIIRNKNAVSLGVASSHSSSICLPSAAIIYTAIQPYLSWIREISGVTPPNLGLRTARRRAYLKKKPFVSKTKGRALYDR